MAAKLNFSSPVNFESVLSRTICELQAVEGEQADFIEITTLNGLKRVSKSGVAAAKKDIQTNWSNRYPGLFI